MQNLNFENNLLDHIHHPNLLLGHLPDDYHEGLSNCIPTRLSKPLPRCISRCVPNLISYDPLQILSDYELHDREIRKGTHDDG